MDSHWFLDLEETIINSWHDQRLCNVSKIKKLLKNNFVENISIFSFAIWNEKDRQEFISSLKDPIQRALDVNIGNIPTQEEILKDIVKFTGCKWELQELSCVCVWGKHRLFLDFCQFNFKNTTCVLVDDVVPNLTFINKDINLTVDLINVNTL
jgi:hypothetical protein